MNKWGSVPYVYVINEGSRSIGDTRWLRNCGNLFAARYISKRSVEGL